MTLRPLLSYVKTLIYRRHFDADLDRELRAAVDELAARHIAQGCSPAEAERRARIALGGVQQLKERTREVRHGTSLEGALSDVRYAARGIRGAPAYASAVVLTLALGIGANTAIFSVVKTMLIEPLPYRDPDRLVFVWSDLTASGYPRAPLAGPELKDLRDRSTRFEGFGAIWANTAALTDPDHPEQLRIGLVTTDFFSILGVGPALGRTFAADDDQPGAAPTILLSWDLWQRRYGGDVSIVGRGISVDGAPTLVVGVMPRDFRLWMPLDANVPDQLQAWRPLARRIYQGSRGQQFLRVVGRMRAGVTVAEANREVASIGQQLGREFADYATAPPALSAVSLHQDAVREVRPALLALFGAVSLLLVLACVNVASLIIARAAARRTETAMRAALGASRWRLCRLSMAEGVLLSIGGGICAVAVAWTGLRVLLAFRPEALNRLATAEIDGGVLAFTAAAALGWGLLLSLAPAAEVLRTDVAGGLGQAAGSRSRASSGTPFEYRLRAFLVMTQIVVGLVLVISAGLLFRAFSALQHTNLGFSARSALTFKIALPRTPYSTMEAHNAFSRRLAEELSSIPGVAGVGGISHLPYDNLPNWSTPYVREDAPKHHAARDADARTVTPGFFETMGATLVAGRYFTDMDEAGKDFVAIVDERLAERTWPGENAVGRRLRADPTTSGSARSLVTVVGVIEHIRHRSPTSEVREQIYFSHRQVRRSPVGVVVTGADPAALADSVKAAVRRLDPQLPISEMRPLADYIQRAQSVPRFTMLLAGAFSAVALLLASVGIYGLLAYAVTRRRHEIAVRMALGAAPPHVLQLVLREAVWLASIGGVVGVVAASIAATSIRSQLYQVGPLDPMTYGTALIVVAVSVLTAAALPAWRATRVTAIDALRGG